MKLLLSPISSIYDDFDWFQWWLRWWRKWGRRGWSFLTSWRWWWWWCVRLRCSLWVIQLRYERFRIRSLAKQLIDTALGVSAALYAQSPHTHTCLDLLLLTFWWGENWVCWKHRSISKLNESISYMTMMKMGGSDGDTPMHPRSEPNCPTSLPHFHNPGLQTQQFENEKNIKVTPCDSWKAPYCFSSCVYKVAQFKVITLATPH